MRDGAGRGLAPAAASVALGLALAAACGGSDPLAPQAGTPVVLVIVDTLRADHLSCYGYELETSPTIDALAERSYLFASHTTQVNSTFPSITSILTGLYARTHRNYVPVPVEGQTESAADYETLAERLKASGYRTLAVGSHPMWRGDDPSNPLQRGFEEFSVLSRSTTAAGRRGLTNAHHTNERAFELLRRYEEEEDGRPLFLWVHYFDPHTPYRPPPEERDRFLAHHLRELGAPPGAFESLSRLEPAEREDWIRTLPRAERAVTRLANGRALYDGEIRYCDAEIGRLFERLDEMGLLEDALVLLLADHGENLEGPDSGRFQIAFSHERLFEGVARTPLLVSLPGQREAVRIEALSQNVDVLPTVLELLDLPRGRPVEGESLVPLLRDPGEAVHESVFIESSDNVEKAVRTLDWKLIENGAREERLYDWRADPGERRDLAGEVEPAVVESLREELAAFRPADALHVRLVPGGRPASTSLSLALGRSHVERALGPPRQALEDGGARFRWTGTVGLEPVDLTLFQDGPLTESEWTLRGGPPAERVFLGPVPLHESAAVPVLAAGGERASGETWVAIERSSDFQELRFARDAPRPLEVELRRTAYVAIEVTETSDFRAPAGERGPKAAGRGVLAFVTDAPGPQTLALRYPDGGGASVLTTLRVGGRWPERRRIALGGRALRAGELGFRLPAAERHRTGPALAAGPPSDPPPGSVLIWTEPADAPVSIDTSALDAEVVDELRDLGYVR